MARGSLARERARKVFDAFKTLDQDPPDAIVLRNGVEPHIDLSFFYATAIPSGIFEGGMCVLHRDGRVDVFSSILEEESARKAADSEVLRGIVLANLIMDAIGFIVTLLGQLAGLANALGWSSVALYLLFGLGFAYFQFVRR